MQIRKLILNMFNNADFFFIFIKPIANSFVERVVKVASAAVAHLVVVIKY